MKRVRWACPNGCAAVLGSQRPRRDDVVRYCLACSAKTGRLVGRTAPALEAERERHVARAKAKVEVAKTRKAARDAEYFTVHGIDVRAELKRLWRLPIALEKRRQYADWFARLRTHHGRELPKLIVRTRTKEPRSRIALAKSGAHVILLNRIPGQDEYDVKETLAHELAHILTPGDGHGVAWKSVFRLLCEQAYGIRPIVERRYHGAIHETLRAMAAEAS